MSSYIGPSPSSSFQKEANDVDVMKRKNNNMEANYKGILEDFRSSTPMRKFKRGGKKEKLSKRREVRQPAMHSRGGERKGAVFPSYRPVHPGSKSGILYTNYCACKQEPESCTLFSQVDFSTLKLVLIWWKFENLWTGLEWSMGGCSSKSVTNGVSEE